MMIRTRHMFTLLSFALVLLAAPLRAAAPPTLEGSWIGGIDTDRGQMQIGLDLTRADGQWTGRLRTAHGDWDIKRVTESNGVWTVVFAATEGGDGKLTGKIRDDTFSGAWDYRPNAFGTFELKRSAKK